MNVRTVAGIAVLLGMAVIGFMLLPPYFENWKLQQYLNDVGADPATAGKTREVLRANVVNKAAELGLPVHTEDVRVSKSGDALRIEVLYLVRVDLAVYSVDLHFRPAS